jgi:hypothetical protein
VAHHVPQHERDWAFAYEQRDQEREACVRIARGFSKAPGDVADQIAASMKIPF